MAVMQVHLQVKTFKMKKRMKANPLMILLWRMKRKSRERILTKTNKKKEEILIQNKNKKNIKATQNQTRKNHLNFKIKERGKCSKRQKKFVIKNKR